MRLAPEVLEQLPKNIAKPTYSRDLQRVGIVHLGIGAFHRAHQAWYTDLAMDAGDRHWAISGVSMLTADVATQMNPQGGLYTLSERHAEGCTVRVIGAIREVLTAPEQPDDVIRRLASRDTRIASLTITERGYCRASDGSLDITLASDSPFYPLLAKALRQRLDAGLPGLTLLSCDNLADNGRQLSRLLGEYLQLRDPALARWVDTECTCPSTMVDRVTPAPTDDDRSEVATMLGLRDEGAIVTEPFSQWVIEDHFAGPRPDWHKVGAMLVDDVRPHETAKLRMLNAAHSVLAYLGLLRGHAFVHEAVRDAFIRPLAERLMRVEAAPTLQASTSALASYADSLFARFENPALRHRLSQIAIDGSQKIPQRWLATLAVNQTMGRTCPALLTGIAAWLLHVHGTNGPVEDLRAQALRTAWQKEGRQGIALAVFGSDGLLPSAWAPAAADLDQIEASLLELGNS